MEARAGIESPEAGVAGGFEPLCGCRELNSGLEKGNKCSLYHSHSHNKCRAISPGPKTILLSLMELQFHVSEECH